MFNVSKYQVFGWYKFEHNQKEKVSKTETKLDPESLIPQLL